MLVVLPGTVILGALLLWLWGGRYVTTEHAYVQADIAQISAEIAGRVQDVHVQDHAEVRAGVMRKRIERVAAQLGGEPERPIDQHPMVREKQAERERAELDLTRTIIR